MPLSNLRDDAVPMSCTTMNSGRRCSNCCCSAGPASHDTNSSRSFGAGAAADVVLFVGEVVVLVARDLRRQRGLGSGGVPGVGCNCAGSCRSGTAPRGCPAVGDGHRSGPVAAWHFCVGREAPASQRPFGHAPVALPLSAGECNPPARPVVTNLAEVRSGAAPAQRAAGSRQLSPCLTVASWRARRARRSPPGRCWPT